MESVFLVIMGLMLIVLTGLLIVVFQAVKFMKEALMLIRSKFDAEYLRRFDTVYTHLTNKKKLEVTLDKNGKAKTVIRNNRY